MVKAPGGHSAQPTTTERPTSLSSQSRRLADVSFGTVLDATGSNRLCWNAPGGLEIVGHGVAADVSVGGADRIERIRDRAQTIFDGLEHGGPTVGRPRAFGGFSFHEPATDSSSTGRPDRSETAGRTTATAWTGFGDARFVIPSVQVTRADDKTWLTVVGDADELSDRLDRWQTRLESTPSVEAMAATPTITNRARTTTTDEWHQQVGRALNAIETTDLEKVVLAQALTLDLDEPLGLATMLARLRRRYPECYRFAFDGTDGSTFFGAPPERLIAKHGPTFETEALAGSVPPGSTPDEEASHAARLRRSDKLDAEHAFVVDAIRSNLEAIAESVTVEPQTVKRLATIQHLQTPMSGTLGEETHVLDVVAALHPTPAVGGVPQETACETIQTIEPIDRGWYAAPVGWFDANGDGEFAVGIRSGVTDGGSVSVFAGNGIVAGSDAAEEAAEIELKFRSILDEFQ